jgi:hypothetical protein
MGSDRMELRLGGDYAWATRGAAVISIAGIATVGLLTAWSPQMRGHPFAAVWVLSGMSSPGLVWLYEVIWQSIGPLATVDATGLTYRTRWGLRRVCFADVVRAEFGIGGQLRFNYRDGRLVPRRSRRRPRRRTRSGDRYVRKAGSRAARASTPWSRAIDGGFAVRRVRRAPLAAITLAITGSWRFGWAVRQSIG